MAKLEGLNKEEIRICDSLIGGLERTPFYEDNHIVSAKIHSNGISIGYRDSDKIIVNGTNFYLQMIEDIGYILDLHVREEDRGKGYGRLMVGVVEDFFRNHGCRIVRTTPSGMGAGFWPHMGYIGEGRIEAEKILSVDGSS